MIRCNTINCLLLSHTTAAAVVPAAAREAIVRLLLWRLRVSAALLTGEAEKRLRDKDIYCCTLQRE